MIRTTVFPTQSSFSVKMTFPAEYLGSEIEIIAFKKNEGISNEHVNPKKFKFFDVLKIDTTNNKFDREEANAR